MTPFVRAVPDKLAVKVLRILAAKVMGERLWGALVGDDPFVEHEH